MAHMHTQTDNNETDNTDDKKQRLKVAMGQLNQEQQQLLQLTQFQGLKYAEVADIMGCSLSVIKVRVHRTMKSLRAAYINTLNHGY